MVFDTISSHEMQTARIITGATMAIVIGVGLVPPLRPFAQRIRMAALVLYILSCVAFVIYVLVRR